jgi:hypothetical protein
MIKGLEEKKEQTTIFLKMPSNISLADTEIVDDNSVIFQC